MKKTLVMLSAFAAGTAFAAGALSIGAYTEDVRRKVSAKLSEALDVKGRQDKIVGCVTYCGEERFCLQNGSDGLKAIFRGKLPTVGENVRVYGVPTLEAGRVVLIAKSWKSLGTGRLPAARAVTAANLIDPGPTGKSVDGLRVRFSGRAIGVTEKGFAVNVDDVPVNVMVASLPAFLKDCDRTHPVVEITGVAELMLDPSVFLGREGYVMGVKISVADPADLVLKPDISYLVAKRELWFMTLAYVVFGLLAFGLLIFFVVIFRQRHGMFRTRTIMAERKRMADDLHDTIEQHLVGAGMLLKINRLKEAQDVLVRAKREIRDIVWGLKNDDMMRLTPAEMLRKLAHEENTKGIFRVDTHLEGLPVVMDAAAMRDLSLIVRESIGNAVKHGGAKHIAISSDPLGRDGWKLRISNDGTPFDPDNAPGAADGHFGIEGMKQRARRIGATVSFERRGKGMVLILEKVL